MPCCHRRKISRANGALNPGARKPQDGTDKKGREQQPGSEQQGGEQQEQQPPVAPRKHRLTERHATLQAAWLDDANSLYKELKAACASAAAAELEWNGIAEDDVLPAMWVSTTARPPTVVLC